MQNSQEALVRILEDCYPIEVDYVGPSVLEDIVDGVQFGRSERSSNLDLSSSIEILVAAVTLGKAIMEIYIILRDELQRPPTSTEIKEKLASAKEPIDGELRKSADTLVDAVLQYFSAR
jgi:hypothetical protein